MLPALWGLEVLPGFPSRRLLPAQTQDFTSASLVRGQIS